MDPDDPGLFEIMAYIVSRFPDLEAKGIVGYLLAVKTFNQVLLGDKLPFGVPKPIHDAGVITSFIIQGHHMNEDLRREVEFILERVQKLWPHVAIQGADSSYPSFHAWYEENNDQTPGGFQTYTGSRLLDAKAVKANLTASKLAFEASAEDGMAIAYILSGHAVWNAKPRGGSNSVCPAWRTAVVYTGKCSGRRSPPRTSETNRQDIDVHKAQGLSMRQTTTPQKRKRRPSWNARWRVSGPFLQTWASTKTRHPPSSPTGSTSSGV